MTDAYLVLIPLAIELVLIGYVAAQPARNWAKYLFILFMLLQTLTEVAVILILTSPSLLLAQVAMAFLIVSVFALTSAFLPPIAIALYFPQRLFRWHGLPLFVGIGLAYSAAVIADLLTGRGLLVVMPEMGRGYVPVGEYMRGPLIFLVWMWLFAGVIVCMGILVAAWRRTPSRDRGPIAWLFFFLLVVAVVNPILPPYSLAPTLNPTLFSVVVAVMVARYRIFQPAEAAGITVFRSAPSGLIVCDTAGRVVEVNPALADLTGISPRGAIGRPVLEVLAPLLEQCRREPRESPLTEIISRGLGTAETTLYVDGPEARVLSVAIIPLTTGQGEKAGFVLNLQDVTERESARLALEDRARLVDLVRELSSPIIPVMRGVLIMPLIGTIDSERARGSMQDMLRAIQEHRARAILIDITGVPVVDTIVASYLLQAVRAATLLGCQGVLVGIRAEVARMLVELGLDLSGLETRGSLQDGLEYAVELLRAAPQ